MATQQLQLVCDSSTLANYKAWAKPISDWFRTCGWTNSTDTGQLNGVGGGVGGAAGWAALATVPGSAAFYYEIFQPGDGLGNFYYKVEYGNVSGANSPSLRISVGTSTNGAGTLTGFFTAARARFSVFTPPSTTTQYECNFSGDSGKIAIMMWRNAPSGQGQEAIAIQRSLNSSGTPTGSYVTVWHIGWGNTTIGGYQQSLSFSVGPGPICTIRVDTGTPSGIAIRGVFPAGATTAVNGGIPVDFAAPCFALFDYPCTVVGGAFGADITEGVTFTVTNQYGQTKTYMPSKLGAFASISASLLSGNSAFLMEYD